MNLFKIIGLAVFLSIVGNSAYAKVLQKKTNFLYIITDEHNFRTIGAYRDLLAPEQAKMWGETVVETPNLDYLADNGAIFSSMYATSPSCTPSRASMFTGNYPQTVKMPKNGHVLDHGVPTLADVLSDNGYHTGYVGKWHLIGKKTPMWAPEYSYGFQDKQFMFNGGHWKQFKHDKDNSHEPKANKKIKGADDKSFATDWLTNQSLNYFDKRKDDNKPFFHVLSIPDPHTPNTVRAPYDKMYDIADIEVPKTWNEIYSTKLPGWKNPEIDSATKELNKKTGKKEKLKRPKYSSAKLQAMIKHDVTQYFGMVKCIDDNIGRIIARLKANDQLDNTVIIFSADHGDLLGEFGRDNKGVPQEGSAKIPFIVYYPKSIKAGTVINQAANNTDLMGTVLGLMNAKFDHASTDGRDLSPWLTGKKQLDTLEDITFVRYGSWAGAFTDRYKLVFDKSDTKPWLIDMEIDPSELTNFIDSKDHKSVVKELAQKLQTYAKNYKDDILLDHNLQLQLKHYL